MVAGCFYSIIFAFAFVFVHIIVFAEMIHTSKRVGPWCKELLGLRVRQLSNRHFVIRDQDKGFNS